MPIIKSTNENLRATSTRVRKAYSNGYNNAKQHSAKNNCGKFKTAYNISASVTKEIVKSTTIDDLPYIAGAIGLFTPIPLASPVMLGLGKIVQIMVKKLHKP